MKNFYRKTAVAITISSYLSIALAGGWIQGFGAALPNRDELARKAFENSRRVQEDQLRELEIIERENAIKREQMELELLKLRIENEKSAINNRKPSNSAISSSNSSPDTDGMECYEDSSCKQGIACRSKRGEAYKCK
jgi:hypothetical protein